MIRCVRLWTGEDENSHFAEGVLDLEPGPRSDHLAGKMDDLTGKMAAASVSFEETASGGAFAWHTAPGAAIGHYAQRQPRFPDARRRAFHAAARRHPARRGHRGHRPQLAVDRRTAVAARLRDPRAGRRRSPFKPGSLTRPREPRHDKRILQRTTRRRPDRRRHHERHARRLPEGTRRPRCRSKCSRRWTTAAWRAPTPGTTPAPATPPIAR